MIIGEQILEKLGTGQALTAAEWLPPGKRVLEIGCSAGYLTHLFLGKSSQVFGVDMNSTALVKAKDRHPHVPIACADAEHLPFADGSFDVIIMLEVIEHTGSDTLAITELRRVLRPGGVLILSTPNAGLFACLDPYNVRQSIQRAFPVLYRAGASVVRFESGQYTDNLRWHRHYRLGELVALLERDFIIEKTYRGGLLVYPVVAALISIVGRVSKNPALLRILFRILNWDFRRAFGPLSYNLMVLGQKKQ